MNGMAESKTCLINMQYVQKTKLTLTGKQIWPIQLIFTGWVLGRGNNRFHIVIDFVGVSFRLTCSIPLNLFRLTLRYYFIYIFFLINVLVITNSDNQSFFLENKEVNMGGKYAKSRKVRESKISLKRKSRKSI